MPIYFGEYANILFPKMSQQGDVGYQQWLSKYGIRESDDYDTYAAYQSGLKPGENGHLGDEFKLPNHITYSKQSLSSKKDGAPPAGEWQDLGENKWAFKATETNVKNAGGIKGFIVTGKQIGRAHV